MARIHKHPVVSIVVALLAGWIAFVAVHAGLIFVVPHGPGYAPEVGPSGVFFIFGLIYTGFYLANFGLIALPLFLWFRRPIRPWRAALWGAGMFALSVPVWFAALGSMDFAEIASVAGVAVVPGAVVFCVLSFLRVQQTQDENQNNGVSHR